MSVGRFGTVSVAMVVSALLIGACSPGPQSVLTGDALGLPAMPVAAVGAPSAAQIGLGRKLFFDRRLSFNGTLSCAMCHVPEEAFTSNASKTSVGMEGRSLRRNAPTLLNVAWQTDLFHDGRESSLATQAWLPLLHADEMGNPSIGHVLQRLLHLPDYTGLFERAFDGRPPGMDTVGLALAAFQTSLVCADSRFDRWRFGADERVLTTTERHGFEVFAGKGGCIRCHTVEPAGALLSDRRFHVTGAGQASGDSAPVMVPLAPGVQTMVRGSDLASLETPPMDDLGRFEVTLEPADRHAFRTPSLRNVARTSPYMHDGSLPTLQSVVEFYDRGGGSVSNKSPMLVALGLSSPEKEALVAFLGTLTGDAIDRLALRSRPTGPAPRD